MVIFTDYCRISLKYLTSLEFSTYSKTKFQTLELYMDMQINSSNIHEKYFKILDPDFMVKITSERAILDTFLFLLVYVTLCNYLICQHQGHTPILKYKIFRKRMNIKIRS